LEIKDSQKIVILKSMEQQELLLKDYSDQEKGAYLGAIASIATADHSASEEEIEHLMALADSAGVSVEQKEAVRKAAIETSPDELRRFIEILRTSELRFSLVTDLISFAKADNHYTEEEKTTIEGIAQQLDINKKQYSLLDEFADKTSDVQAAPEQVQQQGFLSSLIPDGLKDKLSQSGINVGSLAKGLLGIAGPMILAGLLRRGLGGRSSGGGLAGGSGGGLLGGLLGGGAGRQRLWKIWWFAGKDIIICGLLFKVCG
jgi:uncharacterized tellurite resistance protein B-like protein